MESRVPLPPDDIDYSLKKELTNQSDPLIWGISTQPFQNNVEKLAFQNIVVN